jgi:hypothetical protein
MGKKFNLKDQRFGRLLIIAFAHSLKGKRIWHTRCACGGNKAVTTTDLISGNIKSCGCLRLGSITKHGMYGTPTYRSWSGMIQRCFNSNNEQWDNYGGRGIEVCKRWLEFKNFLVDMGEKPKNTTIERVDNDGNYELDNCKWDTLKQQANNRRSSHCIQFHGQEKTLQQWSEETGIPSSTIRKRLKRGWGIERALTTK